MDKKIGMKLGTSIGMLRRWEAKQKYLEKQKMVRMNSTAVTVPNESQWTPEQMQLITKVIAKDATPDELKLFIFRCQALGLDPFKPGMIHFVKYGTNPGTIVVGIEGFRAKAGSTGLVSGVSRGVTRDEKGKCIGAWAEVHRKDWTHPAREEVSLAEYTTGRGPWLKMPETMIKKVAEAAALRMAFPDQLGGVYTNEEMDQAAEADKTAGPGYVKPEDPGEGNGITPDHGYRIPFGKYAKRALEDIATDDLKSYVNYLEAKAFKDGKEITGVVKEFIDRASDHIAALENGMFDDDARG